MKQHGDKTYARELLLATAWLLAAVCMSGCRSVKTVPTEKTVYIESVNRDTLLKRDSIYVHDSIYTHQKGDTVYRDRWHRETVYKEIYRNKTDTCTRRDSIAVPYAVEKALSKWERTQLKWASWWLGALCMILVYIGYKLWERTKNAKYNNHNKQG